MRPFTRAMEERMRSALRLGGTIFLLVLCLTQGHPGSAAMVRPEGTEPMARPAARDSMGMANDAARGTVVLFGGYVFGRGASADTWTWDGAAWTERRPADAPSARCCMAMTYDPARKRVVLFGGIDQNGITLNDTWTWDGSDWTFQHPATSPDIDPGSSMAYDAGARTVVLFEGHHQETWSWDGTNWTENQPADSPPFRDGQVMARYGADVVLFGGNQCGPDDFCELNDTWLWNGSTWTQQEARKSPTPRCCAAAAYDLARRRMVLFGGLVPTGVLGTTWTWNGASWVRRTPPLAPSPRAVPGMAFDSARAVVVLFGGYNGSNDSADTWTWDGVTWTCADGCS
jgi:Galactose oxidase, central domain